MTQRFSRLGVIAFLPVSANIFVITVAYSFPGTTIITGLILLANLALIVWELPALRVLLGLPAWEEPDYKWAQHSLWAVTGVLLLGVTISFRALPEQYNTVLWFSTGTLIAVLAFGYGLYLRKYLSLPQQRLR